MAKCFDVFTFMKDALDQNVPAAVTRRGGFGELISRGGSGFYPGSASTAVAGRSWGRLKVGFVSFSGRSDQP